MFERTRLAAGSTATVHPLRHAAGARMDEALDGSSTAWPDDVSQIKTKLKRYRADDIFDESVPFSLPSFQVRAYRRRL